MKVLDESTHSANGQCYELMRIVKIGDDKVRIRVRRDFYAHQSWAVAEVFSAEKTWNHILGVSPGLWYDDTPRPGRNPVVRAVLGPIADGLVNRVQKFLEA